MANTNIIHSSGVGFHLHIMNKPTYFITGITGFLGSFLAFELMQKGFRIIALIRPQSDTTAEQRFQALVRFFGMKKSCSINCKVISGYLTQNQFGLDPTTYKMLAKDTDFVLHCAASTSFSERKRDEVEQANLNALQNVLYFAADARAECFFHISTCYAVGRYQGLVKEKIHTCQDFYNVYEETKCIGEHKVIDYCQKNNINYNIFRPSIVYGHSQTGFSLRFNALYFPVKILAYLGNLYKDDIDNNQGKKAKKMGVYRTKDSKIFLPMRVQKKENGRINIIPVDFFVKSVVALIMEQNDKSIFHIVSPHPQTLETLVKYVMDFFRVAGLKAVLEDEFINKPENALELLYSSYIKIYGVYMQDERIFDMSNTKPILDKYNIVCPQFSYTIFQNIMEFALKMDWGKNVFANSPHTREEHC